jgi:glucuronate isomerase
MTRPFIHPDFLLDTPPARELYHRYAESLPIIDYHCHLSPADIANDRRFSTLTEPWLEGDHYKWRAMRTCGVEERYITGTASPWEKFQRWAETVPKTLRNPLYHWTHLELHRPFGISDRLLCPATARSIWEECNAKLALPEYSVRGILRQMRVEALCTTDDPCDSLEHHTRMAADPTMPTKVYPAFRADKATAVDDPKTFIAYVQKVSAAADADVRSLTSYLEALRKRHEVFHGHGCRLSDYGLEEVYAESASEQQAAQLFERVMRGERLERPEVRALRSVLLLELAMMDAEEGWVQQFHLGAMRNNNTRMMRTLGPDTGFDSIGDFSLAAPLARFLDRLDDRGKLAKTILYNLNPRDNELIATMIGNFQDGSVAGKLQYGSAWWFLDQIDGMSRQIEALSMMGLLGQFVGMVTDSRSFLSYPRHEYFRRLLCNILGADMQRGLIPDDLELVGAMVSDVAYHNVRRYLNLPGNLMDAESTPAHPLHRGSDR